ncbi:MAG: plastocyanin/azurin family copper-binding protein [Erythrobacter sp.]
MLDRRAAILGTVAMLALQGSRALAEPGRHIVEMTGHPGGEMAFAPRILRVAAGDVVTFRPAAPSHSCVSTPGMLPAGAESWRGGIGKSVTLTFSKPGFYGVHCLPHRSLGMVGLVIVDGPGRDANLAEAKAVKHPGKAAAAWQEIWREAGV